MNFGDYAYEHVHLLILVSSWMFSIWKNPALVRMGMASRCRYSHPAPKSATTAVFHGLKDCPKSAGSAVALRFLERFPPLSCFLTVANKQRGTTVSKYTISGIALNVQCPVLCFHTGWGTCRRGTKRICVTTDRIKKSFRFNLMHTQQPTSTGSLSSTKVTWFCLTNDGKSEKTIIYICFFFSLSSSTSCFGSSL